MAEKKNKQDEQGSSEPDEMKDIPTASEAANDEQAGVDEDKVVITEEDPLLKELEKGVETTTVKNWKEVVKEKLAEIRDLATLEVRLPVGVRMTKRLETIRKMSRAESLKIDGNWKTIAPKMFISQLDGRKISSEEAMITFKVYETDENGNKKPTYQKVKMEREDGTTYFKTASAEYRIAMEVKMTIIRNKPISQEITRFIQRGK